LCRECLYPPKETTVSKSDLRYWLRRLDDETIASITSGILGRPVDPSVVHSHRVALIASAQPDE
jgi:hypothetical protein